MSDDESDADDGEVPSEDPDETEEEVPAADPDRTGEDVDREEWIEEEHENPDDREEDS